MYTHNINSTAVEEQLYDQAISLIRKKENPEVVKLLLVEKGLDEEDAYEMLSEIISIVDKENLKTAKRNIFFGLLICAAGVVFTIKMETLIPSLLILGGLAQFIIGLTQLPRKNNSN